MKSYQRCILLTCFTGIACLQMLAQSPALKVERRGNRLHVTAPQLHFLEGRPLERLNNGASVAYTLSLILSAGSSTTIRQQERFILSYDLWEEKFSVVVAGSQGRSASHLTAAAAEAWCLDNLQLPLPPFSPEKTFTVKLECSYLENEGAGGEGGSVLTLAGLIDIFSRKKQQEQALRWEAVSGPLRLMDMKQDQAGGRRTSRTPGT